MKHSNLGNKSLCLSISLLVILTTSFESIAEDQFEIPVDLSAAKILSPKLLSGDHHKVDDVVRSDGYLNYYVLRSDYGDFEVASTMLLAVRVREVEALATLDDVSKTGVFLKAAANAGVGQLTSIKQFATHPIESVTGIPKGIGRMFKRYSRQAGEAVDASKEFVAGDDDEGEEGDDSSEDDSNAALDLTESYFGVSGAERAWAQELGTDPYTSNATLKAAIKQVAWADRLGRFGMKFASIPEIPGADIIGEVNDVVWSKDPYELADLNREHLSSMGASDELIEAYLSNPHMSPTQLTYLTAAISELEGAAGRVGIVLQALGPDTEAEVGFFVKSVTMLAWFHLNKKALAEVLTDAVVPRGVAEDGTVVVLFATDYIYWTETVAGAAEVYGSLRADEPDRKLELWLLGGASERTLAKCAALGIEVHFDLADFAE